MKEYSELLLSWGLHKQALELSKICAKVDVIMRYNQTTTSSKNMNVRIQIVNNVVGALTSARGSEFFTERLFDLQ
jgi:hypothetical protein